MDFPVEGLDMSRFSLNYTGIYDLYAVSNHKGDPNQDITLKHKQFKLIEVGLFI